MKKLCCLLLTALLVGVCAFALADSAVLNAEPFDWGEAITSITVTFDEAPAEITDVKVEATVTYMDYSIYQNVTETKERVPDECILEGNTLTIKLPYAALDAACTAYPNSTEIYKITVNGKEITDLTLVDPAVDAFIEFTGENYHCRLFVPETDAEKVPMVVWLHGAGEQGADNRTQISANLVTNWATPEAQACFGGACYILAPQAQGPHNVQAEMEAILKVMEEYPNIDPTRIYVGGCSMGGGGTMNMICTYPEFFAAAFPICPAGSITEEAAEAFAANGMPVYLIHSIDDGTVNVSSSAAAYELLTAKGAKVFATLFEHSYTKGVPEEINLMLGHWSWTYVHRNFDAKGDDEDGTQYHAGEYVASGVNTNTFYNGEPFDYGKLNEGYSWMDQSTWTTYGGEPFDAEKLTTEEEPYEYHMVSCTPEELGFPTFFDWLAAQHK
ncbi:MAG: alpha/beta hydrolase fold domain-containing protein [Clostridia bacterium]|nr:alpha/beta hydrolase fold domain-containing protein [Clostridia bacterium]MBR4459767.1 alpha/beta hydrolase fold domain-containing protein [Clostridia bacterium]